MPGVPFDRLNQVLSQPYAPLQGTLKPCCVAAYIRLVIDEPVLVPLQLHNNLYLVWVKATSEEEHQQRIGTVSEMLQ